MNFYTLTSSKSVNPRKWISYIFALSFIVSFLIIFINFIVDPYNITGYNILKIKYKFARDDRTEKIYHFKTLNKVDNILIGSSRVYSINPQKVSQLIGGTTYNFGIGTATVEDHLGVIKYLKRENKLPKNIIIGVDYYTFNPKVPPTKYFLKNKELNFLSYNDYDEDYLSKLFSIDSLRASIKTLKYHFKDTNIHSRFDKDGWALMYEDYKIRDEKSDLLIAKKELSKELDSMYLNFDYQDIDKKRIEYYDEIKKICEQNDINLYIFTTPLHPLLLEQLHKNKKTSNSMTKFTNYLKTFDNFTNMYEDKDFYNEIRHFRGATHTTANAGDIILQKVLNKN